MTELGGVKEISFTIEGDGAWSRMKFERDVYKRQAFLISFVLLVGYGIATKQGTNYALMVMIVLAAVVAIFGGIEIDRSVDCITKGVASQANMFLIFVSIDVLLNLVTLGGGFDALSNLLGGLAGNSPTAVMLVASVVGGFGIEAAAVAEIQIITDMFGGLATQVGLPMGCFAVSILAATRLTGSAYPTTNFAGQLGTAQCSNTKEALQACWISVAFACVFVPPPWSPRPSSQWSLRCV